MTYHRAWSPFQIFCKGTLEELSEAEGLIVYSKEGGGVEENKNRRKNPFKCLIKMNVSLSLKYKRALSCQPATSLLKKISLYSPPSPSRFMNGREMGKGLASPGFATELLKIVKNKGEGEKQEGKRRWV